jgi:hypothetical protein
VGIQPWAQRSFDRRWQEGIVHMSLIIIYHSRKNEIMAPIHEQPSAACLLIFTDTEPR